MVLLGQLIEKMRRGLAIKYQSKVEMELQIDRQMAVRALIDSDPDEAAKFRSALWMAGKSSGVNLAICW